jgi:hypothetical protein
LQDGISFGMGQNRRKPTASQARETVGKLVWDAEVAEFNQQIIGFANRVGVGLFEGSFQILEGKMEIAAQTELQLQPRTDLFPKLIEQPGKVSAIVSVTIVGVGGGDSMGNTVVCGHAAHFDGDIPGLRAVVDLGQNVAVNVDHDVVFTLNHGFRAYRVQYSGLQYSTIRTHPAGSDRRPSKRAFFLARGAALRPCVRIQPKGSAFLGLRGLRRGAELRCSRLLVHDSGHGLFVPTLDIEEQVCK